jgi:hypothetical protein
MPLAFDSLSHGTIAFGFQELIKYVWQGGYPRWKDDIVPVYITEMKNKIIQNPKGLFRSMAFEDSSSNR